MDSNVNNVQQSFLDAMNIIASRRVKEANYDKTIVGTINSWVKDANGKAVYKINYNGGFFNASVLNNQDSYLKNTPVYIFVPQGDFSQEKIILGKVSNINTDINIATTAASLNNFSIVGKNNLNWISENNNNAALKSYLKNNFNWIYKIADNNNFIDIDMKSLKQYLTEGTAIMIKADFRTALSLEQKQQASAEYGLIFNLVFDNEYLKWGNTQGEILQTIIDKDIVKKKINDEEYNLKNYIDGIDNIINEINDNNIATFITNSDSSLRAKVFELEAFYEAFIKNLTIEEQDNEINVIKNIIESYLTEINRYFNITTAKDIKTEYQNWKKESIEQDNKIIPLSLDSNRMIGSPLYFKDWTTQYAVFEIEDLQDFNHIDSILFFKRGFETSLNEEKLKDDIFVKNICFYVLKPLESVSGDYFLKVECSEQGSILQKAGIKETTFKARFFRKTEDITGNTNILYYWFKEDPSITIGQEFYHPYGGQGWKLINKLTKNSLFTTTYLDNPTLKNNYKCVAVLENSDSTVLITAPFIVYNSDKGYAIELQSDTGLVFQSDIGTPIITCTVNGEEKTTLDNNEILLKYYWSFITQDNKTFSLQDIQLEEGQELNFSKLTPLNFDYYQSQDQYLKNIKLYTLNEKETKDIHLATRLQYPISNLSLNEIFTIKCDVTKVENEIEVLIGSEEINLEKRGGIAIEGYHIEFENDGQVFQYDEYGNSPKLNGKLDSLEILPIRAKLVAPNGVELAGTNIQVDWIFNLNNSMIIPLDDVTVTNGVLKDKIICNFDIKDLYDPDAINNQILCHIHFNEKDYYKQTNLLFRKIGENGTNGTDVIIQIKPASSDPILDTQPLTLYTFDDGNEKKGFFNNNYYTNIDTTPSSQIKIASNSTNIKEENNDLNNSTNINEKDNDLLKSYAYQKNELLISDKIDSITWNLAGNPSESIINKGKNFKIISSVLYWDSSENKEYQLQIIKTHIKKDNQDYYSYYPLPIINYYIDKNNIKSYAKERLAIDKNSYLKEIMYNADGRNPIYNHNQGLKLLNLPENCKLIFTAKGGWNEEENEPDFLLFYQNKEPSTTFTIENGNDFDMIYVLPNDSCSGSKTNNRIEVVIQDNEGNLYATVSAPIIFTLNTFGLASLNAWDGNSVTVDDEGGYILAPQIGAGEKDLNNRFTGIVMGKTETPTGGVKEEKQIGLLGYSHGLQSIFLDAETGNATFGLPSGYILEEEDDVFVPKKSDNNNNYREGRIELRPGGVSNIGGWRIGHKSLYYTNEEGTLGNKNGVEQSDYILRPDGTIGIPKADASAKGEERERQLNPYGYYHDKDIAHDQGGILLYGGNEPYISIKTKPLKETDVSDDSDSLLVKDDSLELQLDPNTPTLFTIFRHNGSDKTYNSGEIQYPKNSRTFLAGINSRGEFIANSVTNKSNASVLTSDGEIEYVKDIASKFYFNILNAFDDQKDRPNHVGFKMTANGETLGQFFVPLKIFTDVFKTEENKLSEMALNISGGQVENINNIDSWWGEYYRPINLYGRNINLFAPPFEPTGSNNLKAQKWSYNNLIIDRDYGQMQVGDTSLLKLYSETDNSKNEEPSLLTSIRDLKISAGKFIEQTYIEQQLNDGTPLWTLGDTAYKKLPISKTEDIYIDTTDAGLNGPFYLKNNKGDFVSAYDSYYKVIDEDEDKWVLSQNFTNSYYQYEKNQEKKYVLKTEVINNLFKKEDNVYKKFNLKEGQTLNDNNLYFWEKTELDKNMLQEIPYYYILEDNLKQPFIKIDEKKYYYQKDKEYLKINNEYININDIENNSICYKDNSDNIYYQNGTITKDSTQNCVKYYKYLDYFIDWSKKDEYYREIKTLRIFYVTDATEQLIDEVRNDLISHGFERIISNDDEINDWNEDKLQNYVTICKNHNYIDETEGVPSPSIQFTYDKLDPNESSTHVNCYIQAKKQSSSIENKEYILFKNEDEEIIDINLSDDNLYLELSSYYEDNGTYHEKTNYYIHNDNNNDEEYIWKNGWYKLDREKIWKEYIYTPSIGEKDIKYFDTEQEIFYDVINTNNLKEIAEEHLTKDDANNYVKYSGYYITDIEKWIENDNLFSINSFTNLNNNLIEYCLLKDDIDFIEKNKINDTKVYYIDTPSILEEITSDTLYKKIQYEGEDYFFSLSEIDKSKIYKATNSGWVEFADSNVVNKEITEQTSDKKYTLLAKEYTSQITTFNDPNTKISNGLTLSIENKKGVNLNIKNLDFIGSSSGDSLYISLTGAKNLIPGQIGLSKGAGTAPKLGKYTSQKTYGQPNSTSINQPILGIFKANNNGLFITKDLTSLKTSKYLELQSKNYINIVATDTGNNITYSRSGKAFQNPQITIRAGGAEEETSENSTFVELNLYSSNNHWATQNNPIFEVKTTYGKGLKDHSTIGIWGLHNSGSYYEEFQTTIPIRIMGSGNSLFIEEGPKNLKFKTPYKGNNNFKDLETILNDLYNKISNLDGRITGLGTVATQDWVTRQHYLTIGTADNRYAPAGNYANVNHKHSISLTGILIGNQRVVSADGHLGSFSISTSNSKGLDTYTK